MIMESIEYHMNYEVLDVSKYEHYIVTSRVQLRLKNIKWVESFWRVGRMDQIFGYHLKPQGI